MKILCYWNKEKAALRSFRVAVSRAGKRKQTRPWRQGGGGVSRYHGEASATIFTVVSAHQGFSGEERCRARSLRDKRRERNRASRK